MATTALGIVYPTNTDVLTPLAARFASLATSADAAITAATTSGNQNFYGLAAGRASVTGMKFGDEYQESDGDRKTWRYNGTSWKIWHGPLKALTNPGTGWSLGTLANTPSVYVRNGVGYLQGVLQTSATTGQATSAIARIPDNDYVAGLTTNLQMATSMGPTGVGTLVKWRLEVSAGVGTVGLDAVSAPLNINQAYSLTGSNWNIF